MLEKFVIKHDTKVTRMFEMLPGMLTWSFILSPIWLGIIYPTAVVWLLIFLTLYWLYLAMKSTIGLAIGYPQYVKEMEIDWWAECEKLDFSELPSLEELPLTLKDTKHFVVVPVVNEPEVVLRPALDALYNQNMPTDQIVLVYSIEAKYEEEVTQSILNVLGDRINEFHKVLIYAHPAGIPGEAIGSGGGNRTWGATRAVEWLKEKNERIEDYIFTSFDADHVPDRQYLSRIAHLYLTSGKPHNRFYSTAVHLFNNNHWNVPSMMRIEANFVTMGTLSGRSIFWKRHSRTLDTFASFSTSLKTLIDIDFWDVSSGVDDTTFFWRAFFKREGDFEATKHYIPYSADAVEGKTYLDAHKSLYKQLLRWGWGVIEVPISMKQFLVTKTIPLKIKLLWAYDHLKTRVFMINITFLITFGFGLLTLANENVRQSNFAYSLPTTTGIILTFALIFLIPAAYFRSKLTPPIPDDWPLWKRILLIGEGVLVIFNLLTFSFFPFVDAQTRMMLGKKMKDIYHTPKVRN